MTIEPDRARVRLLIDGESVTVECKHCQSFRWGESELIEFRGDGDVRVGWGKRFARAERVTILKDKAYKVIMESVMMEIDGTVVKTNQVEWTKANTRGTGVNKD
jgi:hypothetical protein